jgi:hypothetical protein
VRFLRFELVLKYRYVVAGSSAVFVGGNHWDGQHLHCFSSTVPQAMATNTKDVLDRLVPVETTAVFFTRVARAASTTIDRGVVLANLWDIKQQPWLSAANISTDNISEHNTELSALPTPWLIQDTNVQAKRLPTLAALTSTAAKVGFILPCCSPPTKGDPTTSDEVYVDNAVKALILELLVGMPTAPLTPIMDVSVGSVPVAKANAMVCDFGMPFMPPKITLLHDEELILRACGTVHAQLAKDPQFIALPPIIISCPPFSTVHAQILDVLQASGADLSRVMFNQIALTESTTDYWKQLLQRYPCSICIDTWGYSGVFCPTSYPDDTATDNPALRPQPFPSDLEMANSVVRLIAAGLQAQLTLSLAMYCKIQWTQYGGYGYGYLHRVVAPLLRERLSTVSMTRSEDAPGDVTADSVHSGTKRDISGASPAITSTSAEADNTVDDIMAALLRQNALRLIHWRPAPVLAPIAVQQLPCHICRKLFTPGNHFSKFQFDYCSSACLSAHRKNDFK